ASRASAPRFVSSLGRTLSGIREARFSLHPSCQAWSGLKQEQVSNQRIRFLFDATRSPLPLDCVSRLLKSSRACSALLDCVDQDRAHAAPQSPPPDIVEVEIGRR